jgi:hypothetical protein
MGEKKPNLGPLSTPTLNPKKGGKKNLGMFY